MRAPMIVFDGVTKIYEPNVAALSDVSFVIDKGEFVFVVGASGSGKSTVVRLLLKELEPTSGRIIVAGPRPRPAPRSKVLAAAAKRRLRLPGLQAASEQDDRGERGLCAQGPGRGGLDPPQGARGAEHGRPRAQDELPLPTSSPAVSSSASRSRAPSSTTRRCWSATSRPETSTPTPPSGSGSSLPDQPRRYDRADGHPRPRDGRQDAAARDRARRAASRDERRGGYAAGKVSVVVAEAWRSLTASLSRLSPRADRADRLVPRRALDRSRTWARSCDKQKRSSS